MTPGDIALAALGWTAFAIWVATFVRCLRSSTPGRRRRLRVPTETQHASIVTVLIVVGGGTLAATLDLVVNRDTGDLVRGMVRSAAFAGGVYGLIGTRG